MTHDQAVSHALPVTRTSAAKVRFEQTKKLLATGFDAGELPESITSPTISRLRGQYAQAARREAVLAATLGPQHPALIQARSDLAKARALLNGEIARVAQSSKDDHERAVADEASLANNLQTSKDEVLKTGDAEVRSREIGE